MFFGYLAIQPCISYNSTILVYHDICVQLDSKVDPFCKLFLNTLPCARLRQEQYLCFYWSESKKAEQMDSFKWDSEASMFSSPFLCAVLWCH